MERKKLSKRELIRRKKRKGSYIPKITGISNYRNDRSGDGQVIMHIIVPRTREEKVADARSRYAIFGDKFLRTMAECNIRDGDNSSI